MFFIIDAIIIVMILLVFWFGIKRGLSGNWIFNILRTLISFGGAAGALLGMLLFRHKTRRWYFWTVNLAALGWQLAAVYAMLS